MYLMQKFQPTPTEPTQAMIMRYMPLGITIFMLGFPSGLVLYWTISNLLTMMQQWYVGREIEVK